MDGGSKSRERPPVAAGPAPPPAPGRTGGDLGLRQTATRPALALTPRASGARGASWRPGQGLRTRLRATARPGLFPGKGREHGQSEASPAPRGGDPGGLPSAGVEGPWIRAREGLGSRSWGEVWRAREAPCPQPPRESCGKPVETRGPRLPHREAWIQGVDPGKPAASRLSPGDEQAVESLGSKVPTACGGPPHNLWIACGMGVKRLGSKPFYPHPGVDLDIPEKRRFTPLFPVDRLGSKGVIPFSGAENTHTLGINLWPTSVDPRGLPWGNGVGSHMGPK